MNKTVLLVMFFVLKLGFVQAAEHHSGHKMGGGGGGEGVCNKPQLSKFLPPNMAMVSPGSEFSFRAFYVQSPDQIAVTVKKIPVDFKTEDKESFYIVKANLPAELKNTVARINITVNGENKQCSIETGWLLKISE
jgi:hypothetical protein